MYNSSTFLRLKERIPQVYIVYILDIIASTCIVYNCIQVELASLIQRQIASEFHDLPDLYSVLAVLDIVIGFIVSTGGSPETFLEKYIHETLKMPSESGLVSRRAERHCCLKHVISLWRLLMLEKGRRLSLLNQVSY